MSNSIHLNNECFKLVKQAAVHRGLPTATYMNEIVKSLGLDNDDKKVILAIPKQLIKNNKDELHKWLNSKVEALMNVYYPSKGLIEPKDKSNVINVKAD